MLLKQVINMPGRRPEHPGPVREDDRLKNIDHLGDAGHLHSVRMLVEEVQVNAGHQCVAHGILLIQEARIGAGFHRKPGAPFVHDHAQLLFRIILIHDSAVHIDQVLHVKCFGQCLVPGLLIKLCRTALDLPSFRMSVIMKGKTVRIAVEPGFTMPEQGLHHAFGPLGVIDIGAAGDPTDQVRSVDIRNLTFCVSVLPDIGLVTAVFVGIKLRCHIAAAAPVLIAHSKEVHLPGCGMTVFCAKICHGGYSVKGHVLHPFGHFLHGAAAEIAVDIGLAAQLFTQFHIFMGTEAVIFYDAAPVGIDHFFAVFFRTDSVLPVILVRKTASRPAEHRDADLFQRFHDVTAHPVDIGNLGILAHENAFIDASSQMFGKLSVDFLIDSAFSVCRIDEISGHVISSIKIVDQPFTAPAVIPSIRYFWKIR